MAVLVLADHQDGALSQPTRSTVAAAAKLGDVHVLIAGGATGPALLPLPSCHQWQKC